MRDTQLGNLMSPSPKHDRPVTIDSHFSPGKLPNLLALPSIPHPGLSISYLGFCDTLPRALPLLSLFQSIPHSKQDLFSFLKCCKHRKSENVDREQLSALSSNTVSPFLKK